MDRTTRESRRSSMPSTPSPNAFPRRRHPTIALRGSSQEGQVEMQETVRLKAIKRRRGSNSHNTEEESVMGNEQHQQQQQHYDNLHDTRMLSVSPNTASSVSDQNHHRRISTSTSTSTSASPRHWNITDEMIGVTVPRKARSASVKRAHEEQSLQSAEAASPSSSNVSLRKKMRSTGPKTRLPFSSTQEDIEIEIAELLYGLRSSKSHESSSSQKLESNDSPPPRSSTSPSSYPSTDAAEKKIIEDHSSSTLAPINSASESVRIESEQPAKMEKPSPESARISGCHDDDASGHEIGSSKSPKGDIEEENFNSGAGFGDTADGRSERSKLDVDKGGSASIRLMSSVAGANDDQRVDNKFEIDLMAPPPMTLSPERDNLSRGEDGISIKVEDKVERLVKKENTQEGIEEVKMKFDLEKPNKHNDVAMNHELEEQDRNKEQSTTLTNLKVEKTVQSNSMPLSTSVSEWSTSLSLLGYMSPLETVVKTDKTTGSTTAQQQVNFVLSQPRPRRCATHHYIARNIFMHQQCTKMNPLLSSAIGYGSVCDTKPNNVNRMHCAENAVVGKQSQRHTPGMNQNAVQEKGWAAKSDYSLVAIKSSGPANPMDSIQTKQLVLGPHPGSSGNLVHGPAFLFPPGQHQASVTTATSQAGGVSSSSSASSSSNKSHSSAAGSLGTSTPPTVATAMSFSYPNLAANDAPYVTIVQNSGYPFPFSTPVGASAAIRGASPAQVTPILNGPLYSSQMFHPLQHPHPQALVQPGYLNASTSSVSSSSHNHSQGTQVNSNNMLTSTSMQLQQSQKQHNSLSHPYKHETGMAGEHALSVASGTTYSQKNVFGQNFTIPVQPLNLSFRPSATSDSVGGNSGNFGDKQQQQQALKGGVERIPSQAFSISFPAFNGSSVPSNLNFSTMAQNPVIFQSLPDVAWQGYQAASTSHTTQQKMYSITEGKSGGKSSHQDDEKKATSGKPSTNGPTTLVFDNSSKNLNFASSPMNGNWPSRSIASPATTTSLPPPSNASNSQQPPQLLHLQQQHGMLQQQSGMATRYKASSTTTNATPATKFLNSPPVFSQTQTQCKSSNQASQSKNSGRTPDSQVHNTSILTSTTPTFKSFSQEQGRVLQGHTQISFGGNYMSSLPPQGQQLPNNNQPFGATVAGTPPNGGNLKTNSQGSKVSSSVNTSQMQQTENSSAGTGQNSSPVCGRNVPSILSSCPGQLSELKY